MKGGPQGVAEGVAVGLRARGCWRGEWPGVSLEVVGQGVSGGLIADVLGVAGGCRRKIKQTAKKHVTGTFPCYLGSMLLGV